MKLKSFYDYMNRAYCYDSLEQVNNSIGDYSIYISNNLKKYYPKIYSFACKRRAVYYILKKDYKKAELDILSSKKYNISDYDPLYLEGVIEYRKRDKDSTAKKFIELLKKNNKCTVMVLP